MNTKSEGNTKAIVIEKRKSKAIDLVESISSV